MRTEQQIIKAEKLSTVMVEAITYGPTTFVNQDGSPQFGYVHCKGKTEKALIARGLIHPANFDLTPKGIEIVKEILADRDAVKAARTVEQETAPVEVEPTIDDMSLCDECTGPLPSHAWNCSSRVKHVYTAKMVERDESAEFMARHPEETAPEMNLMGQHRKHPYVTVTEHWKRMTDRDKLARSIAYEYSHRFLTWGINDPQPEQPIVPRDLDRMRMFQFYQDGSIYDPGQLLAEIRNEMTDQAMAFADAQVTTGSVMTSRMDAVNAMLWLGWLNGYILECGAVDSDGWQNRVRGPQDGWEELGLYSTEPSDATELPAWADPEDNESFGCVAVISPQGRYSDAENCGDGITREEYHAHGSEFGMCEQHRLAKIAADDKGW